MDVWQTSGWKTSVLCVNTYMKEYAGKSSSSSPTIFVHERIYRMLEHLRRARTSPHVKRAIWTKTFNTAKALDQHSWICTDRPPPTKRNQNSRHPFATEQCQLHRNWTYIEHTPPVKNWRLLSQIGHKNMVIWFVLSYSVSLLNSWAVAVWLQSSGVASRLQSLQVESREMERSQVPWKLSNSLRCRAMPTSCLCWISMATGQWEMQKLKGPKVELGHPTKCAGYEQSEFI